MKKLLLSLSLVAAFGTVQAQNIAAYGFNGTTADLTTAGWVRTNQSQAASTTLWTVASYAPVTVSASQPALPFSTQAYTNGQTCPAPNGQDGGTNSFALVNYTSTSGVGATGVGTISNWLISPVIDVQDGDVVSFYSRIGKFSATNTASFADNLQLRMSTNGSFTTDPSTGATDVGDYTTLLVEINPNLNLTSYPATWTQYTATISGVGSTPVGVKFGFRYYVPNGGPNGANSDIIGIDTFSVDRLLGTDQFFASNFAVYPNPASNVLNIDAKNAAIKSIQMTDLNGRTVKTVNTNEMTQQVNIADLNAGVYFLKVTSDLGTGTTKVVKN